MVLCVNVIIAFRLQLINSTIRSFDTRKSSAKIWQVKCAINLIIVRSQFMNLFYNLCPGSYENPYKQNIYLIAVKYQNNGNNIKIINLTWKVIKVNWNWHMFEIQKEHETLTIRAPAITIEIIWDKTLKFIKIILQKIILHTIIHFDCSDVFIYVNFILHTAVTLKCKSERFTFILMYNIIL